MYTVQKCSFSLRISSLNITKFSENCGFGHIYWRNCYWKAFFFCAVIILHMKLRSQETLRLIVCLKQNREDKNSFRGYVTLSLLPVTTKWSLTEDGGDIHLGMNFSCEVLIIM